MIEGNPLLRWHKSVELALCVRNSQAVAQSRPESNEQLRQAGGVRSQKNPFAQDNDAVEERRVAHDKVIEQAVAAAQVRRGAKLPAPSDDPWLCYKSRERFDPGTGKSAVVIPQSMRAPGGF